jgi:NAD(P)-dependent dehydrogenase (short-subunit alcohol dehydrogenase family)
MTTAPAGHAVVAGGTKGLGLVVVERFLARGFAVTVLSRKPSDRHLGHPQIRHLAVDLENPQDIQGIWMQACAQAGPVRYMALCQRFRGPGDSWAGEIQVGLGASRSLIEGFGDCFCDSGDRGIGVVSSVYAQFVGGSQPIGYHVVKAGLNSMVRYYAWVLGRRGIRVNAIMPLTYMKQESRQFYQSNTELLDVYDRFVPLRRMGEAEDCANAIDFLCSDKAAFINGQSLFVDGGVSVVWPEEVAKSIAGV